MKRPSHLGLLALVAASFALSTVLVAGAVLAWGSPAGPARALAGVVRLLAHRVPVRTAAPCAPPSCLATAAGGFDRHPLPWFALDGAGWVSRDAAALARAGALEARVRELARRRAEALREARARMRMRVEDAIRERRAERLGTGA